jgi:hypothetical protein
MTKPHVNGTTHPNYSAGEATQEEHATSSEQFAELTLACLIEEQFRCKKALELKLIENRLVDWQRLITQWLWLFSGIEHELSHSVELPFCQVAAALQTRWSTNRELAQRLSKLDFLTWRFQSTGQTRAKWDFREQSLVQFKELHGPWTAYQASIEFPDCASTEDWLLAKLEAFSDPSGFKGDATP